MSNWVAETLENWLYLAGGCFIYASQALQNNLAKIYNARNNIYAENFKLKLCTYIYKLHVYL